MLTHWDPKTRLMRQACYECPRAQCGVIHMFTHNKCSPSYALNRYQMPPRREKQKPTQFYIHLWNHFYHLPKEKHNLT